MRTLLINGFVSTPADPGATAVLVDGDRIAWVGHEGAALAQRDGVDVEIDLLGALLTPAFVDAHVHVTATGMNRSGLDLTAATSAADLLERVRHHSVFVPAGDLLLGHGWDETAWPQPTVPTRAQLDAVTGRVPVYLPRVDVHSALVNSALLAQLPGIADLPGYDPDGWLRFQAHHAARREVLDRIGPQQRDDLQRAALDVFAAAGVAAVHEMAGPDISSRADLASLLTIGGGPTVFGYWGELGAAGAARDLGAVGAGGDLFVDGAIGSRSAWLTQPYCDAPNTCGVAHISAQQAGDHIRECTELGIQAGFHVIGDAAIDEVVTGLRQAAATLGIDRIRAARHRLEHVEMPSPQHLTDLADLGVTVSVQPQFDATWGGPDSMYATRLGGQRAAAMNPFAQFLAAGVAMAFGSDTPVTAIRPWASVAAAIHATNPTARISARAAFAASTRAGWRAVGVDDGGVIAPGYRADLAVWDARDLTVQTPDARIAAWSTDPASGTAMLPHLEPRDRGPRCLLTMAAGQVIFGANRFGVTAGGGPFP